MGDAILDAVKRGLTTPKDQWPQPSTRPDLPRGISPTADLIKVLLKKVSEDANVAGRLIASSAEIDLIAGFGENADVPALRGWRREIFGEDALRLRAGKLALARNPAWLGSGMAARAPPNHRPPRAGR